MSPNSKAHVDYKRTRGWYSDPEIDPKAVPMTIEFSLDHHPVLTFHEDGRVVGGSTIDADASAAAILGLVAEMWARHCLSTTGPL